MSHNRYVNNYLKCQAYSNVWQFGTIVLLFSGAIETIMRKQYRAPAFRPSKFNIESVYKAEPAKAEEAKLWVKAVPTLQLPGYQSISVKLPRISGSFDF